MEKLTGPQVERFRDALCDLFPKLSLLKQMVRIRLEKNLDEIAQGNLPYVAFELIIWAESQGKIKVLLDGAIAQNSVHHPGLQMIIAELKTSSNHRPKNFTPSLITLPRPTINRDEIVAQFDDLMQSGTFLRILRITGEGKQGKTHLVTKIFPILATQTYRIPSAQLNLKQKIQIPDLLNDICRQFHAYRFSNYEVAYKKWQQRPRTEGNIFPKSDKDEYHKILHSLTEYFITDLDFIRHPLLLIFDQLDDAQEATQRWLMDMLLNHLASLPHMRVVIAGRTMPEETGSYAPYCESYELHQVRDKTAYIAYCREREIPLGEEGIVALAHYLDYRPGAFAEAMSSFTGGQFR